MLGNGETCTGDSARRAGNEFVFQGLAQQNVETFKEFKVKKVVSTCAHCFNTLKNEYPEFGIELEVVHHTQLLNRLVREGQLTPVASGPAAAKRSITYHDPCYLGRHNQVYSPPRELLQVLPGASYVEMPRNSERSFCCGAGGARMWMEETIGERINDNRTNEAVATGADQIAVGCPFCRVMLSDGLTAAQAAGDAREEVEVLDVAQMLLASVKGEAAGRTAPAAAAGAGAGAATAAAVSVAAPPAAEPPAPAATPEPAAPALGGSLFDVAPAEPEPAASAEPAAPPPPAAGGSLFDVEPTEPAAPAAGGSLFDVEPTEPAAPAAGGSLFDVAAPVPAPAEPAGDPHAPADPSSPAARAAEIPSAGSLFDLPAPAGPEASETATEPPSEGPGVAEKTGGAPTEPASSIPSGSLFDMAAPAESTTAESTPAESTTAESTTAGAGDAEPPVADAPRGLVDVEPADEAETHEPRTDVDINETGSLFDL